MGVGPSLMSAPAMAASTSTLGSDDPLNRDWLSETLERLDDNKKKGPSSTGKAQSTSDHKRFTIVTWNIWFSSYQWQARLEAAIRQTLEQEPDAFCFQEVTADVHNCMLRCKYLRDRYVPTESHLPSAYDCSVWIRANSSTRQYEWTCTTVGQNAMQSIYGRRGLCVDLKLTTNSGQNQKESDISRIRVVTAHLESGKGMASIRRVQMDALFSHIRGTPWAGDKCNAGKALIDASFLVGDFNLDPSYAENELVDANGLDLWKSLRPQVTGYTEDTYKNKMRYLAHGKHKQVRYDRVVQVRQLSNSCTSVTIKPLSINILGTEPFDRDGEIWVSDHFGFVARVGIYEREADAKPQALLSAGTQASVRDNDGHTAP